MPKPKMTEQQKILLRIGSLNTTYTWLLQDFRSINALNPTTSLEKWLRLQALRDTAYYLRLVSLRIRDTISDLEGDAVQRLEEGKRLQDKED